MSHLALYVLGSTQMPLDGALSEERLVIERERLPVRRDRQGRGARKSEQTDRWSE